jgi:hypothetical protein
MRRALALPGVVLALAAALIIGGGTGDSPAGKSSTVGEFVSLATSGVNVDYTPLASPRDAVSTADLIVEGTLTDVVDGIALTYPDPRYTERRAGSYATLVVTVEKVISGDPGKVRDGRVYVTVHKSRAAQIGRLAGANPHPRTVAVLDDITTWTPSSGVRVTRPGAIPSNAPLYAPYNDGLWLQGPDDTEMSGLHAHPDELAAAWGRARTVAQFSAAVERATAQP